MIEKDERLGELFAAVSELPAEEQAALLARECVGQPTLLAEIESLLGSHARVEADGFMHERALDQEARREAAEQSQDQHIGQAFGRYRILSLIGEGGMGEVYLAADPELDRQVAVKLIKSGRKTKELLRRFAIERQILAQLDHDNIARLLDVGTTDEGYPFLVMEYIDGRPIGDYCNSKELSISERLKLFRPVCSGIHYAHQNLVIHRDLKPSNVLVTSTGQPKLLDFGIAKLLDPTESGEADVTATMLRVMTPEYASPEQIKGEPITTASDVYSLGVLLYQLLTGHSPYKLKRRTTDEITKAVCEQEPTKPSSVVRGQGKAEGQLTADNGWGSSPTVSEGSVAIAKSMVNPKLLRGDLDNIVLKALRKEPARRYQSVAEFSEDIRRHLEGLPVIARKSTLSYRSSKFIQRNKIGVAAAAIILLTLIGGIIATAWEAHKARVQSARAEERFNEVRGLAHSVLFDYHDAIASLPGSTLVRERLVKDALKYLDELADDEGNGPSLQRELAAAYLKVGDVQSSLNRSNVGNTSGALTSYRKSVAIREELFASDPRDLQSRLDLSVSYARMGDILSKSNNALGALENYRKALQLIEDVAANNPKNNEVRRALGYGYLMVARAMMAIGELPTALESFHKSQAIRETLSAENPQDESLRRDLIPSLDGVAYVLSLYGRPGEAFDYYRKSQAISEALVAANPTNAEFRRLMMDTYEWVGITFGELGDNAEGLKYHQKALALCQAQFASDPANAQARDDLGDVYQEIGNTLTRLGRPRDALDNFRKSLENYQAIADADPADTNARRQVYATHRQIGDALLLTGNTQGALEKYRKSLLVFQELSQTDPTNAETQYDVALSYRKIGEVLGRTGDVAGAFDNYRQALTLFERLSTCSPTNAKTEADLALTYYDLGMAQSKVESKTSQSEDRQVKARDWYQKSLDIYQDMKSKGTLNGADWSFNTRIGRRFASRNLT